MDSSTDTQKALAISRDQWSVTDSAVISALCGRRKDAELYAIEALHALDPYERGGDPSNVREKGDGFLPAYLRGRAYIGLEDGKAGTAEFEKILNNRGLAPLSMMYPLEYLYLGRAAKLDGDLAKSRKAYQDFFALWKDADPDIPILKEAKAEYQSLK